jgi:hypothetical protein
MKFNTLAFLLISLVIAINLVASCDAKHEIKYIIVGKGEVCYRSTPNFPRTRCSPGLVCAVPEGTPAGMTGGSMKCQPKATGLKPNPRIEKVKTAKKGQVCRASYPGFPKTKCLPGLECRIPKGTPAGMTGVSSTCQPRATGYLPMPKPDGLVKTAKEGETCRASYPGFPKTRCASGLICLIPWGTPSGMTGVSSTCQKPHIHIQPMPKPTGLVKTAKEGEVCRASYPGFPKTRCASGLICKLPYVKLRLGQQAPVGGSSICQKPRLTKN